MVYFCIASTMLCTTGVVIILAVALRYTSDMQQTYQSGRLEAIRNVVYGYSVDHKIVTLSAMERHLKTSSIPRETQELLDAGAIRLLEEDGDVYWIESVYRNKVTGSMPKIDKDAVSLVAMENDRLLVVNISDMDYD